MCATPASKQAKTEDKHDGLEEGELSRCWINGIPYQNSSE